MILIQKIILIRKIFEVKGCLMKLRLFVITLILVTSACSQQKEEYTHGGLTKDYKDVSEYKSKHELEKAAKANDAEAIFVLASMYATGEGEKFDQKKALELFEKSAQLGSSNAMLQLGLIYRNGNQVVKKNDQKALMWFEEGAKKGNPSAIHNVGLAYYKGLNVKQDRAKAFTYFIRSAELGLIQSQTVVAAQLYGGDGVKKDIKASFKWILKAAEQGDLESQNNVGLAYERGEGVEQDPLKALVWFKRAADHGHALAQYNTALKYYNGAGIKQNLDESIRYAEMAVRNGNKAGIELLFNIYSDDSSSRYNPEKANYWKSKI